MSTVQAFRERLDGETRQMVDTLRQAISSARPGLTERIKWNAPSFAIADDDRITLGLERKGGVRVVFHRGAKTKDLIGFSFPDDSGLAKWPAPDRGVVVFADQAAVETNLATFADLCVRWLERTA